MYIDIFHDTVCPWCWIGKKHLAQALEQWQGEPVILRYHTYFLNDSIPAEGLDFHKYMSAKIGRDNLEPLFTAPRELGRAAGITFNFHKIKIAPNSLDSHRLIALTPDDLKPLMIENLYYAYFTDARDISKLDVLVDIAQGVGLNANVIRDQLASDAMRDEVLAEAAWAQQMGVTGVPLFVFDNAFALSGAQLPQAILRAMQETQLFAVQ